MIVIIIIIIVIIIIVFVILFHLCPNRNEKMKSKLTFTNSLSHCEGLPVRLNNPYVVENDTHVVKVNSSVGGTPVTRYMTNLAPDQKGTQPRTKQLA